MTFLLTGDSWEAVSHTVGEVVFSGTLALRYGLPYLYDDDALIPQSVYDDHRREHTGRDLFTFVAASGFAYPRADVIGVRASGGGDQAFLRELDLALPLVALALRGDEPDAVPTRIDAAVLVKEGESEWERLTLSDTETGLPSLLVEHIHCFRLNPSSASSLPTLLASHS
jgi:hypothetical protein